MALSAASRTTSIPQMYTSVLLVLHRLDARPRARSVDPVHDGGHKEGVDRDTRQPGGIAQCLDVLLGEPDADCGGLQVAIHVVNHTPPVVHRSPAGGDIALLRT